MLLEDTSSEPVVLTGLAAWLLRALWRLSAARNASRRASWILLRTRQPANDQRSHFAQFVLVGAFGFAAERKGLATAERQADFITPQ